MVKKLSKAELETFGVIAGDTREPTPCQACGTILRATSPQGTVFCPKCNSPKTVTRWAKRGDYC